VICKFDLIRFQKKVLELEESNLKPVFTIDNVHYCWIKHRNIYSKYIFILVVAVAKRNPNVSLILTFMIKLRDLLIEYFNQLEDESIKDNFVLMYELLDEVVDHGYPQITDTKILKEYIKTESNKIKVNGKALAVPNTGVEKISWRPEGIKYKVNQAFLNVVERVNSLVYL
jgi:AP-1 complex subunit mu